VGWQEGGLGNGNIDYEYRIRLEHRGGTGTYDQTFRFGEMPCVFQRSRFNKKAWDSLPALGKMDKALFDDVHEMYMQKAFKDFDEDIKDVTERMVYGRPVYAETSPRHGNVCLAAWCVDLCLFDPMCTFDASGFTLGTVCDLI
jgi:hypothetical protein